jgi:tRNA 5-methylaminomethyl-2-thiouridine biosynthesis bifunctional protein
MNSAPITPAALAYDARGLPFSAEYHDIYHPQSGALAQARHVFIGGNALPQRWQERDRFVVLETGFGLGNNFLATWQAWRDDPRRCARLVFISIEQHPLTRADLIAVQRESTLPELADALQRAWPPLTHNLHRLSFDDGRVELLLALGDVQAWLKELVAEVDAFYLDGFAPDRNPRMWDERICKALGRLAAPGATLATWSAAHALRAHLTSAGFAVQLAPGQGGKRDITLARFAPAFTPRRAPSRRHAAGDVDQDKHALIVGAGLAGCAAAAALAEHGWHSMLLERRTTIASEASGNPAGLFHGIVNAQDGVHARFNRAAAVAASAAVRGALERSVSGQVNGLLRLEATLDRSHMQALLDRLGLPSDYVQALNADEAAARAGIALPSACWFYPEGGWVHPAGLALSFLERAGARAELRTGVDAHALERMPGGWRVLDAHGATVAEAPTLVLANAGDALRLLGRPDWPITSVRGQISLTRGAAPFATPRLPIAGRGYLLPEIDGRALFGATAQPGDDDPSVRDADHALNLAQLARLLGHDIDLDPAALDGRTGWRCSAADRLPVIGAVPDVAADAARLDQPRFVPRLPGLYAFTALGSRGITWSALGAQVLAASITGAPAPVEASLLDAIDPARFVSRRARRSSRG